MSDVQNTEHMMTEVEDEKDVMDAEDIFDEEENSEVDIGGEDLYDELMADVSEIQKGGGFTPSEKKNEIELFIESDQCEEEHKEHLRCVPVEKAKKEIEIAKRFSGEMKAVDDSCDLLETEVCYDDNTRTQMKLYKDPVNKCFVLVGASMILERFKLKGKTSRNVTQWYEPRDLYSIQCLRKLLRGKITNKGKVQIVEYSVANIGKFVRDVDYEFKAGKFGLTCDHKSIEPPPKKEKGPSAKELQTTINELQEDLKRAQEQIQDMLNDSSRLAPEVNRMYSIQEQNKEMMKQTERYQEAIRYRDDQINRLDTERVEALNALDEAKKEILDLQAEIIRLKKKTKRSRKK